MAKIPHKCPRCQSPNYLVESKTKHHEGFSVGKALIGTAILGTAGAIIGGASGKKKYTIKMKCKDCGYAEEYEG